MDRRTLVRDGGPVLMSVESWARRASGLLVPTMGFADHPLGRWQPCVGPCCGKTCCMQVVFSSVAGCMGGTYKLERVEPTIWRCTAVYNPCFSTSPQVIEVELTESGGTYYITVTVDGHTWQKSYETEPDPCAFVDEAIPHNASGSCDSSSATCDLTAYDGVCPSCGFGAACDGRLYTVETGSELFVDLGAGGFTNVNCSTCTDVSGIFVLTPWTASGHDCQWRYNGFCDGYPLAIILSANMYPPDTDHTLISVRIDIGGTYYSRATYSSGMILLCEAYIPRTLPVVVAGIHSAQYPPCAGSMPATIDIGLA